MDKYFICNVAIAPLRHDPSDRSEIVSQLLFGERVAVVEQTEKWWLVENKCDGYQGWMDFKQLEKITDIQYHDDLQHQFITPLQVNNEIKAADGSTHHIAAGSILPFYQNGICYLGDKAYQVCFEPTRTADHKEVTIEEVAKFFQNAPYLWGGRTLFGIDCSGFSQLVYKMLGIQLKRDAAQQAEQGQLVDFLPSATTGDLAFFDNQEGKITHVGIMLGNDKIIHASGKVRIDPIDNQGIYNADLGKYTHQLRIVKRISK